MLVSAIWMQKFRWWQEEVHNGTIAEAQMDAAAKWCDNH